MAGVAGDFSKRRLHRPAGNARRDGAVQEDCVAVKRRIRLQNPEGFVNVHGCLLPDKKSSGKNLAPYATRGIFGSHF